jgi:hypothetical protein
MEIPSMFKTIFFVFILILTVTSAFLAVNFKKDNMLITSLVLAAVVFFIIF